ncbi:MAG: class I SAM-dependent DNA methyltransferase [Candidatus Faecivicinus sp.]
MSAYGDFAGLYDQLMDDFDYPGWASYYLDLLQRAGVAPRSLCDCACGTGSLSIPLAARGIRVTGVDLSEEMLRVAADKARRSGVQLMFVRQDMRRLSLPRPVDALICGCDGVNYLLTDDHAMEFFQRAHSAIRPGGALAFDVSSAYKLEHVLGDNFFGEERDEVAYLWFNRWNPDARTVRMDLTFFRQADNGLYRRFSETHVQRAHDPQRLKELLEQSGFVQVSIYGDRTFDLPKSDELRIHLTAVRE